jgi:SAM-dependent methyltransferase
MAHLCLVCQGVEFKPLYAGILKCNGCGFVFADMALSEEELFKIYRREYFFGQEYSNYLADQAAMEKNFLLRLKILRQFLNPERHRSLLEIGSAYGFFLNLAKDEFTRSRGIDITEDGVRHCQEVFGLDVIQGDLLQTDLGAEKIDMVCMWDTLEHLARPDLYLEKISRHMEPGALLALTTGDIGSAMARWKKQRWRLIHPPTHLHYFSKATLIRLLERTGFEVVYCRPCGFYRSVDNVFYTVCILRSHSPWIYRILKKSGLGGISFYLNLFDIMYIIAKKR